MKNILITGGGFHNKGAQMMTFIAISELAQRFPKHQLIVISNKDSTLMEQKDNPYNFIFMGTKLCIPDGYFLVGGFQKLYAMKCHIRSADVLESKKVWENTEYVVDVSGYALGSKWKNTVAMRTILWSGLADKFHAKIIYMPQSFGPFEYKGLRDRILEYYIRKYMKKADLICAREKIGKQLLNEKYGLKNVVQMPDLVLQNKEVHLEKIYKAVPKLRELEVRSHSIAIIPNMETTRYVEKEEVLSLYKSTIAMLLQQQYTVYVLPHAKNDIAFCGKIKALYADDENVIELKEDLTCLEFDKNVAKFEFLIASRYHSIVHAYRNSVPCVIIGWAEKYEELAKLCGQEEFTFDVQKGIDSIGICDAIERMMLQVEDCSRIIKKNVEQVQKENVFDKLEKL